MKTECEKKKKKQYLEKMFRISPELRARGRNLLNT